MTGVRNLVGYSSSRQCQRVVPTPVDTVGANQEVAAPAATERVRTGCIRCQPNRSLRQVAIKPGRHRQLGWSADRSTIHGNRELRYCA